MKRSFGWKPQLPDYRDYIFTVAPGIIIPDIIDLRPVMPAVYNQGNLGSCVANAAAAAYEYEQHIQKKLHPVPSRLFIYYNARVLIEKQPANQDTGLYIRDAVKTLVKQGVCHESEWRYDISKFSVKPPKQCYTNAITNEVTKYISLNNTALQLQTSLVQGYPFIFGFTVYSSFMSSIVASTGIMPMPQPNDTVEGGHGVIGVGFSIPKQVYYVRNSWGAKWGKKGYFEMPFAYMHNPGLCSDFWVIQTVK